MERPVWNLIDPAVLEQLRGDAILQVPDRDGPFAFRCPGITSLDGKSLVLGLPQERTQAGRGLIRALNFAQDVTIWAGDMKITARPWRCHITGPVFRAMLDRLRARDPKGDLAVVWELQPLNWGSADQAAPVPQEPTLFSEPEVHLDLLQP